MPKYTPLTKALAKWIFNYIDRYEYGLEQFRTKEPVRAHYTSQLNRAYQNRSYRTLDKLTRTHIESHLGRETTCYYNSRRKSTHQLLMIDIDAHEGQTDSWDVATWIQSQFFPGAYWEESTHLRGVHMYLLFDNEYRVRDFVYEAIVSADDSISKCLAALVKDQGFESSVCGIYGLTNLTENGLIETCTQMAKVPRPRSFDDMDWLSNAPEFTLRDLKRVAIEASKRGLMPVPDPAASNGSNPNTDRLSVNRLSTRTGFISFKNLSTAPSKPKQRRTKPRKVSTNTGDIQQLEPRSGKAVKLMDSSSAWERSVGAGLALTHELGRIPTIQELTHYYEDQGLATGEEKRDRVKRHGRAIKKIAKSYDPEKAFRGRYTVGQYLPQIQGILNESDLIKAAIDSNYPRRLTYEDLDVGLGFFVKQILDTRVADTYRFTAPVDGLIAWFRSLKEMKLISRSCNYGKVKAIRLGLVRAGMIVQLDADYKPAIHASDGVGIAQKWGLGENCPEYAAFATLWEKYRHLLIGKERVQ